MKTSFHLIYEERLTFVDARITKFARCSVNGSTYNSNLNRTDTSSHMKAYWAINEDPDLLMYFRSIQFFFRVWALVNNNSGGDKRNVCHSLAYVHWYKFAKKNHALGLNIISKRFYKQGHLISVHRLVKRDSLVPLCQNWLVVELRWPVDFIASSRSECCCFLMLQLCLILN